ncbi:hypothetical protein [Dactylosporangium sp. CA-233914]|uniref:hypothetical protein n=1 Tax=Dactylosporangium sp. CA-233914 TaxID=3239934 RepID=UPI003D91401F
MNDFDDLIGYLRDGAYAATVLAGLILAIVWWRRLARAAAPAVAGFVVLLVPLLVELTWWAAVYATGVGLLLVAVLRAPDRSGPQRSGE